MLKVLIHLVRALILDQRQRRMIMFYTILGAMLMMFAGVTFLSDWLREHLVLLFLYWIGVAWLTILAALLAVFDILMVRIAARLMKKHLESMYAREEKSVNPPGESDHHRLQ